MAKPDNPGLLGWNHILTGVQGGKKRPTKLSASGFSRGMAQAPPGAPGPVQLCDIPGACPVQGWSVLPAGQRQAGRVTRNQGTESWRSCLLSPARALKCGIKEGAAPLLIGPIQEELVPKFCDKGASIEGPTDTTGHTKGSRG